MRLARQNHSTRNTEETRSAVSYPRHFSFSIYWRQAEQGKWLTLGQDFFLPPELAPSIR